MRQLREHPLRTLAGLLVLAFCLFLLSGIPRYRDAKSGIDLAVGDVFWFGFVICALLFVVGGVLTVVRAVAGSRRAA
ncbi:MAG TPA: hypothetical protein VFO98_11240 [Marmoricola sp.]|jgi:CHASE2 domain-containing sensor protein|nr:hypothetical protein [Marmoricola sp.]